MIVETEHISHTFLREPKTSCDKGLFGTTPDPPCRPHKSWIQHAAKQIHDRLVRTSQAVAKKDALIDKLWKKQRRRELVYLRRSELGKKMFGKSQKKYLRKVRLVCKRLAGAKPVFLFRLLLSEHVPVPATHPLQPRGFDRVFIGTNVLPTGPELHQ